MMASVYAAIAVRAVSGKVMHTIEGSDEIAIIPSNSTIRVTGSGMVDILVVGGGGGGGARCGGGGGGGGVTYRRGMEISEGDYRIVVGAGGKPGNVHENGGDGGCSSAFGLTAHGGGGGGSRASGSAGASGGGAGAWGGVRVLWDG